VSKITTIDRRLTACRNVLYVGAPPGTVVDPAKVWETIDELLDQRLAETGGPTVPVATPAPLPKATAVQVCRQCGNSVPLRWVPPDAVGAQGVWLLDCPLCDRIRCTRCKAPITDRKANACPSGHPI
jgi:hypothetical protein